MKRLDSIRGAASASLRLMAYRPGRRGRSLDDFQVRPANAIAFRAASAIANEELRPASVYLAGPTGCGKTHLLQSIARRLTERLSRRVFYARADRWASLHRWALSRGRARELQLEFERMDAFLLDDLESLERYPSAQRGLARLLDRFGDERRNVAVLAGRAVPYRLPLCEPLQDRLAGGLVVRVDPTAMPVSTGPSAPSTRAACRSSRPASRS